jgi:serine phosphatase RsbU (regulator of sigma subunit)
MQDKMLEWSVAVRAREGEDLSGDHYLVCPGSDRYLLAVIDGIGHGPEAAAASRMAVSILEANAGSSLPSMIEHCHRALSVTRGVVMSLSLFNASDNTMTWLGIGNVQGRLLRIDKNSPRSREELFLRSGVIGHTLPSMLDVHVLPVAKGDLLILATDGIQHEFTEGLFLGKSTQQIADHILARNSSSADDALVMVARVNGGAP